MDLTSGGFEQGVELTIFIRIMQVLDTISYVERLSIGCPGQVHVLPDHAMLLLREGRLSYVGCIEVEARVKPCYRLSSCQHMKI